MPKLLTNELEKIKKSIVHLGTLVEENLLNAIDAFLKKKVQEAEDIIIKDQVIDRMEIEIEEECLKILALHQPVAKDLRLIVAILKINNDLERIGDLAKNLGANVTLISGPVFIDPITGVEMINIESTLDMEKALNHYIESKNQIYLDIRI